MPEMVGGSFTAATVRRNELEAVNDPSLTTTVMVAVPFWFRAGVIVAVRFCPDPPNTTFATGTRVGLEEIALRAKLPAGVSPSLTVNAIGPTTVSSLVF